MPIRGRFEYNAAGWQRVLASDEMLRAMFAKAEKVQVRAEQIAPRDTGRYSGDNHDIEPAGFDVSASIKDGKATGRVESNVHYAVFVEFGTRTGTPRYRTLGKALDAAKE